MSQDSEENEADPAMREVFDHTAVSKRAAIEQGTYPFPPLARSGDDETSSSEPSEANDAEQGMQKAERAEDLQLPPRRPQRSPRAPRGHQAASEPDNSPKHPGRHDMQEQVERATKLRNEANKYLKDEKYSQAIEMYSEAVKVLPRLAPETAICLANRSAALLAIGDAKQAKLDAEAAVRFDCMYFKAHFRLGKALQAAAAEALGNGDDLAAAELEAQAKRSLHLAKLIKKNAAGEAAADKLSEYWSSVIAATGSIKGLYSLRLKRHHFNMGEEPIGVGNFANIYFAEHKKTKEPFALKIMSKEGLKRTRIRHKNVDNEIFMEKKVLRRLYGQRYIVTLHNTFQDAAHLFFAMDFCPGGELWGLLKQRGDSLAGLLPQDAAYYSAQLVQALKCLREEGIVHRDLKPENIMLSEDKQHIKLVDFGTAKDLYNTELNGPEHVGTPEYMPPEAVKGLPSDCNADLWSLGNIIFQLLHGRPPFRAGSDYLTMQHALHVVYCFLPKTYDRNGRDLVEQLLRLEPMARIGASAMDATPREREDAWKTLTSHPFFKSTNLASLRHASDQVQHVAIDTDAVAQGKRLLEIEQEISSGGFAGDRVRELSVSDRQWIFDRLVTKKTMFFIPQTFPKFFRSKAPRRFGHIHSHEWLQRTQKTQGNWKGPFSIVLVDAGAATGPRPLRARLDSSLSRLSEGYLRLIAVTGAVGEECHGGKIVDVMGSLGDAASHTDSVDIDLADDILDAHPPPPLLCATDSRILEDLNPFTDGNTVDYSRQFYGVWNGATRTFVVSTELLFVFHSDKDEPPEKRQLAEYQHRWLKFQLHLALLTAEQSFLVLDDPLLSGNYSPLMLEATREIVHHIQSWLVDLCLEFNVGVVFMSNRGANHDVPSAVSSFDALLSEKGLTAATPNTSVANIVSTYTYKMGEDTQRHPNGTPCTLSLVRSSPDVIHIVKVGLTKLEVSSESL